MTPATEIVPDLYVGTVADARVFDGDLVICVLNQWPWDGRPGALWVPVVVANADDLTKPIQALPGNLDLVANEIAHALNAGQRVLVHCREGVERSPLAVAWYLARYRGWALDHAYQVIRSRRPDVVDRRDWLPVAVVEELEKMEEEP